MKSKWYYVAIPLAIFLVYEMLSPKATLLKGSKTSTSGGWLSGIGAAGTGISNLWDSVAGTFASSSSDSTSSTDATGD